MTRYTLILAIIIAAFIHLPGTNASIVNVTLPINASVGTVFISEMIIENAIPEDAFTLEQNIPKPLAIVNWTVMGSKDPLDKIQTRYKDNDFAWSFRPANRNPLIVAAIYIPEDAKPGIYNITSIWFDRNGFSRTDNTIRVLLSGTATPLVPKQNVSALNKTDPKNESKPPTKASSNNSIQDADMGFDLSRWLETKFNLSNWGMGSATSSDGHIPGFKMPDLSSINDISWDQIDWLSIPGFAPIYRPEIDWSAIDWRNIPGFKIPSFAPLSLNNTSSDDSIQSDLSIDIHDEYTQWAIGFFAATLLIVVFGYLAYEKTQI